MTDSKPIRWLKRLLLRVTPTTKTGKVMLYVLALRVFVAVGAFVTERMQGAGSATGWDGWAIGFDFLLFLLGSVLAFRWFRRRFPGVEHGRLQKLLRTGQIRLDGKRSEASDRLVAGQTIRVPPLGESVPNR